jgi:ligand-binding sensor domain-containing protein
MAIILALAGPALAVDPDLFISQYGHRAWRIRDGYFPGPLTSVTQTKDGYLWIGTQSGLIRFDGVRFEPWHPPEAARLPSQRIFGLLGASDGGLWIGTDTGLAEWKEGKLSVYATTGRFGAIAEDRDGTIWAGHTRSINQLPPLCRFANGEFRCFGRGEGLPFLWIGTLHVDARGTLWVGGDGGVCSWKSNRAECSPIPGLEKFTDKYGILAVSSDSAGSLWVGAGAMGILHLVSGRWQRDSALPVGMESESMLLDRHGSLWIGSARQGLLRIGRSGVQTFGSADGLSSDYVTRLYEDSEGNIWVASNAGLDEFRNLSVTTITKREGSEDWVTSVTALHDGGVWMGTHGGLVRLTNGKSVTYRPADGLPGNELSSLLECSDGRLWFGIDDGLAWLEHGRFFRLAMPDGSPVGVVRAMAEDRDGSLWIGTTNPQHALVRVKKAVADEVMPAARFGGDQISALAADPSGGLWLGLAKSGLVRFNDNPSQLNTVSSTFKSGGVRNIFLDSDGLWAATTDGLALLKDGHLVSLTVQNGLPCDDIEAAIKSNDDSLWLKTTCGLIRIPPPEWRGWLNDPKSPVHVRLYDALDGAQAGVNPFTPRVTKSIDGRLWFSTENGGVQVVNPGSLYDNLVVPPVHVLQIVANGNTYDSSKTIRLPPLTKDLEIAYTALSFTIPEKVRFRYKLEGMDTDWQDAGTRRQAFYTNLKPGRYRFRVTACNNDGLWNESGAASEFSIVPAFFQTTWFMALCGAAAAGILWVCYLFHLRRVAGEIRGRMEERLSERERIARELHDTLLQSIQGLILKFHAVAKQIPRDEPARETMEKALDRADQVLGEGRDRVRNLRDSVESIGNLSAAFKRVAEESAHNGNADYKSVVEGGTRDLHPLVLEEAYSIGREAIVNAFRHSEGLHVEVEIAYDENQFRVRVRDDGRGIHPDTIEKGGREDHWGLLGMRERALRIGGHLEIWSRPETGTEVELKVPATTAYRSAGTKSKWFWFGRTSDIDW